MTILKILMAIRDIFFLVPRVWSLFDKLIVKIIESSVFEQAFCGSTVKFFLPNGLTFYRARTLLTKEPQTIEWLKTFEDGKVLWDIGANVGLYSICAATLGAKVVAFEPAVNNLEWLARNISVNNTVHPITLFPVALFSNDGLGDFEQRNTAWGGAHNTFSKFHETSDSIILRYTTVGMSIDTIVELKLVEPPDYLKLDVDGHELAILRGGKNTLCKYVQEVLVELDNTDAINDAIRNQLVECGFRLNQVHVLPGCDATNEHWVKEKGVR